MVFTTNQIDLSKYYIEIVWCVASHEQKFSIKVLIWWIILIYTPMSSKLSNNYQYMQSEYSNISSNKK